MIGCFSPVLIVGTGKDPVIFAHGFCSCRFILQFRPAVQIHTKREHPLDRATIIAELEAARDRLSTAIAALRGNRITFRKASGEPDDRKRHLSAAARRKIGQATKKRWAEWRKKKKAA
jgi:hypothetical protein